MSHRRYATPDVIVDVRDLDGDDVRLNIEHITGAALIVPRAPVNAFGGGKRIETTGFDGTAYVVEFDEAKSRITSSAPSVILGGASTLQVPRVAVDKKDIGPLRVTGDEETMPIPVDDD